MRAIPVVGTIDLLFVNLVVSENVEELFDVALVVWILLKLKSAYCLEDACKVRWHFGTDFLHRHGHFHFTCLREEENVLDVTMFWGLLSFWAYPLVPGLYSQTREDPLSADE